MQTFISLVLHFPFKWPRQGAKTKQHSQQQEVKSIRQRTAVSKPDFFLARCHRDFALIG